MILYKFCVEIIPFPLLPFLINIFISDNLDCFVTTNKIFIQTNDGADFWTNDDWIADWKLFFNVQNGIYLDTGTPLTGQETPLQDTIVNIEDISTYYFTQVPYYYNIFKFVTPNNPTCYIKLQK